MLGGARPSYGLPAVNRLVLVLVRVAVAAVVAGVGVSGAAAHNDPCHRAHVCPSDHHTYLWHGLSCTSYPDERLASDRKTVVVGGRPYWCHREGGASTAPTRTSPVSTPVVAGSPTVGKAVALRLLGGLRVRPAGSMAGYSRARFGPAWEDVDGNGCDTRNDILRRDLTRIRYRPGSSCIVLSGRLKDPYTGRVIHFVRGVRTSAAVQIDHVVALGDAWQTGAARWTPTLRLRYANDPAVLLAVDGPQNEAKGDSDASEWLPPNNAYDCRYATQQVQIKAKYRLWVTPAEKRALTRSIATCR